MKKRIMFLLIITLVLLMAACGSNNEEGTSNKSEEDVKDSDNETPENVALDNENFNATGFPIVNEPITIKFMTGKAPTNAEDYNETTIWKEYNKMTNIEIDWGLVPHEAREERRNLALASDSLPDAFHTAAVPVNDLLKYGEQGVFIELNDLIEEYMPNLTALFEEYPEIKKGLTFPDGNIYSLPSVYGPDFPSVLVSSKLWIRQDWLEQLNMDMPETIDEYYNYLKAVKETDLNGNGLDDEIPYGGTSVNGLRQWIAGAFGIQNRGTQQAYLDMDPETDELRFFPISEGYRDLLQYMNKLYSEGLIQENIYTIDTNQSYAQGSEGLIGSVEISSPELIYGSEMGQNYVGMPALKGPYEEHIFTKYRTPLVNLGGMVLTSENEHVPETLRWMDYFYSDEGVELFFMGVEGVSYEILENGEADYLDEIKNHPDGLTLEQALAEHVTYLGGGYPGRLKQEFFNGAESTPAAVEAAEKVEPYVIDEVWPAFTFTSEENRILSPIQADLHKYVNEMQDKFITGETSLSEWDEYVETVEKMNLEEYMEINKDALERYENN